MSFSFDPDAYWRQTPRMLAVVIEGRNRALVREHRDRAWLALQIARLPTLRRLPSVDELARVKMPRAKGQPQTVEQMKAIAALWASAGNDGVRH